MNEIGIKEPFQVEKIMEFVINETIANQRLDVYLKEKLPQLSRQYVQYLIKVGLVLVNGTTTKPSHVPKKGEHIKVIVPKPKEISLTPKEVQFDVLFEDEYILVINKPPGIVVHPGVGHEEESLVHGLLFYCGNRLSGIGGELRPGIVHRLDVGTSGVMVIAKTDKAHHELTVQFARRQVYKVYEAIVCKVPSQQEGVIEAPIGRHPTQRKLMAVVAHGREAITHYIIKQKFNIGALLELHPKTGRTHQIRVHMKYIGAPIVGDLQYGEIANRMIKKLFGELPNRPLLHAKKIGFYHPIIGSFMEFDALWPSDFYYWYNRFFENR